MDVLKKRFQFCYEAPGTKFRGCEIFALLHFIGILQTLPLGTAAIRLLLKWVLLWGAATDPLDPPMAIGNKERTTFFYSSGTGIYLCSSYHISTHAKCIYICVRFDEKAKLVPA